MGSVNSFVPGDGMHGMQRARGDKAAPLRPANSERVLHADRGVRRTSYLVKRLETLLRVTFDGALRVHGLTGGQYMLLSLVSGEGGRSSSALARRMSVSPQSMNESIVALEAKGLITRSEDRTNRRILLISLTREGRRVLRACDRAVDRIETAFFGTLRPAQLAELRTAIEALLDDARTREEIE
jgi:DNA-binding MarR family transcriptional regulator